MLPGILTLRHRVRRTLSWAEVSRHNLASWEAIVARTSGLQRERALRVAAVNRGLVAAAEESKTLGEGGNAQGRLNDEIRLSTEARRVALEERRAATRFIDRVRFGPRVKLGVCVNLYGCEIGIDSSVGPFVEIGRGVSIGARCKIQSHTYICEGVTIEDEVFVGHGVVFTNDRYPRACTEGRLKDAADWKLEPIVVEQGAAIGSGAVILPGVTIGERATVGAGAVVTKDVAPGVTVAGNPARERQT